MEIWKPVKDYEEIYEISSLGRIRRIKGRILKQCLRAGYFAVDLSFKGKRKTKSIHRLIAEHFIDNLENKPEVNHINGVKTDNRIKNLEWVTTSENRIHAYKNGLETTDGIKKAWVNGVYDKQLESKRKSVKNDIGNIFNSSYEAAEWLNQEFFKGSKIIKNVAAKIRSCAIGLQKTAYGYKWFHV